MMRKKKLPEGIEESLRLLARTYADRLKKAIDARLEEMKEDDKSHVLIYQLMLRSQLWRFEFDKLVISRPQSRHIDL